MLAIVIAIFFCVCVCLDVYYNVFCVCVHGTGLSNFGTAYVEYEPNWKLFNVNGFVLYLLMKKSQPVIIETLTTFKIKPIHAKIIYSKLEQLKKNA